MKKTSISNIKGLVKNLNTKTSARKQDHLMAIIQCILNDSSSEEITVWDSELTDAFKDPQLAMEPVDCVCCSEKGMRIYLDH